MESNTDVTLRESQNQELGHRLRNTLTVVQGLASISFRACDPVLLADFDARLRALNVAHNILLQHNWTVATLDEVINRTLGEFGARRRIDLDGPEIVLRPTSVIGYALAFHELATNALKHGALSVPDGKVTIRWTLTGEKRDRVGLTWRETGGPPPNPHRLLGQGLSLLREVVAAELDTEVDVGFDKGGLLCHFDGPTQQISSFRPAQADA